MKVPGAEKKDVPQKGADPGSVEVCPGFVQVAPTPRTPLIIFFAQGARQGNV